MEAVTEKEDLLELPIAELHRLMKNGDLTSEALVLAYFEQIDRQNAQLNAYISLNKEKALVAAKQADRDLRNGLPLGALHGIPISVKDNILVANHATTAGYTPFKAYHSEKNAPLIDQLLEAGAIVLGKTNLPPLTFDMKSTA